MKIAIFGGAFDPPHVGHKIVAESLIEKKIADEVWFVPVYIHPWAKSLNKEKMTNYQHRLEMLQLISNEEKGIKVKEFKDVSFTFDTLEYFRKKDSENQYAWVMGSEYLQRFEDFLAGHPDLIKYTFLIYPRYGYGLDKTYWKHNMVFLSNMEEIKAASTTIRKNIANGVEFDDQRLTTMLPKSVAEYIQNNDLYVNPHEL